MLLVSVLWVLTACTSLSLLYIFSCGRLNSDFEFGLGSFSLLDEIVTGQEWAKFLNPTQQSSGSQRPLPESADQVLITTNPPHGLGAQSSLASTQHVGENNQWRFSGSESFANAKDFGSQPTPRERSTLVGMDIPEGNHVTENVQNISEPMQHGHSQSDMQPEEFEERQQGRPPVGHSFVKVRYPISFEMFHMPYTIH